MSQSTTNPLPGPEDTASTGETARLPGEAAASQGFYPPVPEAQLKRSLGITCVASGLGAISFTALQGTIFNFYLEDLGLRDKLGFFMGLAALAGLGSLLGSWIQDRFGTRRGLFVIGAGGSRLMWLVIGAIPLLWPEAKGDAVLWPLAGLLLLFFVTHAAGINAWMSWMADLVPPKWQGRFFGIRQVAMFAGGAVARLGFGHYLDAHRNPEGYFALFATSVVLGVANALLLLLVVHRRPRQSAQRGNLLAELKETLAAPGLRKLAGVYVLWMTANCMMGPAVFRFLRLHVELGVWEISIAEMIGLGTFAAFSMLWGQFADRHGQRGALIACLLLHVATPAILMVAGPGELPVVALNMALSSICFCGISLFMWPMLFEHTKRKGHDRALGMAAFMSLLSVANCAGFVAADEVLRPAFTWLSGSASPDARIVCCLIFGTAMVIRFAAFALACTLPHKEGEVAARHVLRMFLYTNPLRATVHLVRYVAMGPREGEEGPFAMPAPAASAAPPPLESAAPPAPAPTAARPALGLGGGGRAAPVPLRKPKDD
ncbi:MAG: MFS transporter [Planctomycetes bacterium]|nr:MFS transporter [Planctomycetota bacterium]